MGQSVTVAVASTPTRTYASDVQYTHTPVMPPVKALEVPAVPV